MAHSPSSTAPLASFKAGSAAGASRPPGSAPRAPAAAAASTPQATPAQAASPSPDSLALWAVLEEQLQDLPLSRSRPLQDPAAGTMKAPVLTGRVLALPAPPLITEQEVLERFAQLADPFFQERERAAGEAVALGDAVLISWEAVSHGGQAPFAREQHVEGRVIPDPRLPGLFEGLVGKPVGARSRFSSVIPEDFDEPSARGQQVDFTVEVHQAVERTPPDAESPELLKALGHGSLPEVMDALGQQALEERSQALERDARMQVYDLLAQGLEALIPGEWVDLEVREQWKAHRALAGARGEPVAEQEEWLKDPGLRSEAELRLRLDLALQAVCARDKVKSGPEEEQQLVEALALALQKEPQALSAQVAREPALGALVKKAAWFIQASEHALEQVQVQLETSA